MKKFINWLKRIIYSLRKKIFNKLNRAEINYCKQNPVYFINRYLHYPLYPHQEKIINTINKENFVLVKAPRHAGKSICIAKSIVHEMVTNKVTVLFTAFNRQTIDYGIIGILNTLKTIPEKFGIEVISFNKSKIILSNGSVLVTNPKAYSIDIAYYDEFAFYTPEKLEEVFYGIHPKRQVIMSTKKKGSVFNSIWTEANHGLGRFVPVEVMFEDIPCFQGKKESMIEVLGIEKFEAEYT